MTVQRNVPRFCTGSICGWNLFQPLGLGVRQEQILAQRQVKAGKRRRRFQDGPLSHHKITTRTPLFITGCRTFDWPQHVYDVSTVTNHNELIRSSRIQCQFRVLASCAHLRHIIHKGRTVRFLDGEGRRNMKTVCRRKRRKKMFLNCLRNW